MVCAFLPSDTLLARPHPPPPATLTALLDQHSSLSHLRESLASTSIEELDEVLSKGRVPFLNCLRTLGVEKLKDRQHLANALGRRRREAMAVPNSAVVAMMPPPADRPDLESAAELAALTTWMIPIGTRGSTALDHSKIISSDLVKPVAASTS